jgi:hypothetical protein
VKLRAILMNLPSWADHPTLGVLLASIGKVDGAGAGDLALSMLTDEFDASLADVLLWFAWPPSWLRETRWEDETVRELLSVWLERTEFERLAGIPEEPLLKRWAWVRAQILPLKKLLKPVFNTPAQQEGVIRRGRLRQKRAVLFAFPDVVVDGVAAPDWIPSTVTVFTGG